MRTGNVRGKERTFKGGVTGADGRSGLGFRHFRGKAPNCREGEKRGEFPLCRPTRALGTATRHFSRISPVAMKRRRRRVHYLPSEGMLNKISSSEVGGRICAPHARRCLELEPCLSQEEARSISSAPKHSMKLQSALKWP